MDAPRIITKYPNRRLYDTEESRYVTLADIRNLVIRKVDFVVIDRKTGDDITRSILLQVISEQEIQEIFDILRERTIAFDNQTWNRRYRGFMDKIKTGSIYDVEEVLRDLYLLKGDKDLSFGERKMLDTARSPDEGYTSGSNSVQHSGEALRLGRQAVHALDDISNRLCLQWM